MLCPLRLPKRAQSLRTNAETVHRKLTLNLRVSHIICSSIRLCISEFYLTSPVYSQSLALPPSILAHAGPSSLSYLLPLSQYSLSVFPFVFSFQLFFTISPFAFLKVAFDSILRDI
jgi:hypothetical protein